MTELTPQITTLDDGRNIRFYEMNPTRPRSMLLLHSEFGDARFNWEKLMPLLAEHYHVIAPDLPGYGESDPLPKATFDQWVDWVNDFIDSQGIEQVILVGASFGALIARLFAAKYPQQVNTLVLVNGGALPGTSGCLKNLMMIPVLGEKFFQGQVKATTSAEQLRDVVMNSSTLSKEFLANIHVNADGLENVMRLLLCAPAPEAKIPETETLLIWGKEDIITPTAIGQTLEKILPNATLFQIADSRHLPHIEAPDGIMWRLKSRLG